MTTTTPSDLLETVVLDDERVLRLRPMRPDDTDALRAMHHDLSAQTVYQRFFAVLPELPVEQAERFTHVDGTDRVAVVAEGPDGELVAVARYDRLPSDRSRAEVAFVVRDSYQHHGLGTALAKLLITNARNSGVHVFVADVLATNSAMFHVFSDAGLRPCTTYDSGIAHLEMPVPPAAAPDQPR